MLPMVLPQNLCLCHQRHGPSRSPPLGVDCWGGYALRLGVSVFLSGVGAVWEGEPGSSLKDVAEKDLGRPPMPERLY